MDTSAPQEPRQTARQRHEDAVAEPCPARATASSGAVVVVVTGDRSAEDALDAARVALERAAAQGEEVVLAVETESGAGDEFLTTREAAVALGVSVSTARRWSDEGRLRTTKTSGGHRRFRVSDLRGLGRVGPPRARLRLAVAPRMALPETALALDEPRLLVEATTRSLYEAGSVGWFAREATGEDLLRWMAVLASACRSGSYDAAQGATARMTQRARAAGASALECALFLDRLGAVIARELARRTDAALEVKEALRLFAVLRQAALG